MRSSKTRFDAAKQRRRHVLRRRRRGATLQAIGNELSVSRQRVMVIARRPPKAVGRPRSRRAKLPATAVAGALVRRIVREGTRDQRGICDAVGVTPPVLSKFLCGHGRVKAAAFERILDALGAALPDVLPRKNARLSFCRLAAEQRWSEDEAKAIWKRFSKAKTRRAS